MTKLTPFLVADRPASLRIIRGSEIENLDRKIGIMAHANVSSNVQSFMKNFPSSDGFYDDSEFEKENGELTEKGKTIRDKTIKFVDSGVFTKEGSDFDNYEDLFNVYSQMDADYGIILDVLHDKEGTIESAQRAISVYENGDYDFNLVGVAQGPTAKQYTDCFQELKDMGYNHIAIGGLLKKREDSKFVAVGDEDHMDNVLGQIREKFPEEWLFTLGCYSPDRHAKFEDYNVWGSDSKGWIFRYKKKDEHSKQEARMWRYKQVRSYINNNILYNGFSKNSNELIIVSCSSTKTDEEGKIPAIDRYQGQYYRMLDKYQHNMDILILSAKYGLITPKHKIENYDKRLTGDPDEEFKRNVQLDLKNYLRHRNYDKVYVNMGKPYEKAIMEKLREYEEKHNFQVKKGEGKIGERLSQMKDWLNNPN